MRKRRILYYNDDSDDYYSHVLQMYVGFGFGTSLIIKSCFVSFIITTTVGTDKSNDLDHFTKYASVRSEIT